MTLVHAILYSIIIMFLWGCVCACMFCISVFTIKLFNWVSVYEKVFWCIKWLHHLCENVVCNFLERSVAKDAESHSGAQGNIFAGIVWRDNFWIFLFKMAHSRVLYMYVRRRGP